MVHVRNMVRDDLLALALDIGTDDPAVVEAVAAALAELADDDYGASQVIVCTCSTISGVAESLDRSVVRIDRPMARTAVATGECIVVLMAVYSTLRPTQALFEEEAASAAPSAEIEYRLVEGAWPFFEAEDTAGYLNAIAECGGSLDVGVDTTVLAQASMAAAGPLMTHRARVLTSPVAAFAEELSRLT
ncbi:MAG: hypothetical protein ACI8Y4_003220 [Candidatus Poriferisodalaceae bacterium]